MRSVDVIYPMVISVDVSVKLPKSVIDFLFSGFCIIRQAPVAIRRSLAFRVEL
jgi:hypothetical protein